MKKTILLTVMLTIGISLVSAQSWALQNAWNTAQNYENNGIRYGNSALDKADYAFNWHVDGDRSDDYYEDILETLKSKRSRGHSAISDMESALDYFDDAEDKWGYAQSLCQFGSTNYYTANNGRYRCYDKQQQAEGDLDWMNDSMDELEDLIDEIEDYLYR